MQYHLPLAYIIDLGWLRIGPPYIYLNINPIIFNLGPLAIRWYGLMYVVGILVGLWAIRNYTESKGITQELIYRVLWWCIGAGLIGGRLYFVVQQTNLVSYYLAQPWHILATWEGGMAFYGAIFLVIPTLFWRSKVERINPWVMIDAAVLFAAAGQIFGRIGNIINGDIIGYVSPNVPWSTVYQNPSSFACLQPATCNQPVQPAAAYELVINLVMLALLFYLSKRVRRPGILTFTYLFGYAITQFIVFFARANDITSFFGLWQSLGLKQAQWTSLVVFLALIPTSIYILRRSQPVPDGQTALTYRIAQEPKDKQPREIETRILNGKIVQIVDGEIVKVEEVGPPTDVRARPSVPASSSSAGTSSTSSIPSTSSAASTTKSGASRPRRTDFEAPRKPASPTPAEPASPVVLPFSDKPTEILPVQDKTEVADKPTEEMPAQDKTEIADKPTEEMPAQDAIVIEDKPTETFPTHNVIDIEDKPTEPFSLQHATDVQGDTPTAASQDRATDEAAETTLIRDVAPESKPAEKVVAQDATSEKKPAEATIVQGATSEKKPNDTTIAQDLPAVETSEASSAQDAPENVLHEEPAEATLVQDVVPEEVSEATLVQEAPAQDAPAPEASQVQDTQSEEPDETTTVQDGAAAEEASKEAVDDTTQAEKKKRKRATTKRSS